jgi:hypothetical protein
MQQAMHAAAPRASACGVSSLRQEALLHIEEELAMEELELAELQKVQAGLGR